MKRMILKGPDFCAVTEDGRLAEYIQEDPKEQSGELLLGKIDRMMPGLNCAFVNIGRKKSGFLPLNETGKTFREGRPKSGETLLLQIRKEETGEKGAFLTRDITLAGTTVIVMPQNRYTGVSSRIENEEERERLTALGKEISRGRFGLVMRNNASEAGPDEIRAEAEALFSEWGEIRKAAEAGGKPGTVLRKSGAIETLMHDYGARGISGGLEVQAPDADILRQLSISKQRKVKLPHGGNIVIDRCEAMNVIDVNTASAATAGDKERTILETNLEACDELVIQSRLRDLSGIIIIDFIDMDNETDRNLVMNRLRECFARDRIKTVLHGWTTLGLMEITRKRR